MEEYMDYTEENDVGTLKRYIKMLLEEKTQNLETIFTLRSENFKLKSDYHKLQNKYNNSKAFVVFY